MPFDVLSGFQVGQQLAGKNAVGIMAENVLGKVNALQQIQLEHAARLQYDPEYRFKYQLYSQLNDTIGQQGSETQSPLGIDRASNQPSTGGLDRGMLQRAALAGVFPLLGKRFEAQETEAGRLAAQYGNPQEAARLQAGVEAEKSRAAVAQRQLKYPGLFKRIEMGVLPSVGAPNQTTVTIPGVGEVSVTREQ